MASISVIVPTYNYGAYIGEALASIQAQTLQPRQILVIDDGSSDDTAAIVAGMQLPNLRYVHQHNAGVSAARNHGLRLADTDYVTFLDADDRWRPTMLEQQWRLLATAPQAVFSFTNFVRFQNDSGELLPDQFSFYPELAALPRTTLAAGAGHLIEMDTFDALISFGEIPAYTQVMMFNALAIRDLFFNESLRICEDTEFVLRAAMRGRAAYTSEVLAEVRRHDNNASSQISLMPLNKLQALLQLKTTVTSRQHLCTYEDRLVKAHIDAAVACCRDHQFSQGLQLYLKGLQVHGSSLRKLKGALRVMQTTLTTVHH